MGTSENLLEDMDSDFQYEIQDLSEGFTRFWILDEKIRDHDDRSVYPMDHNITFVLENS